jgi:DNA-binding IclR family transcriptional regulator
MVSDAPAADRVLEVLSLLAREPEPLAGGTVATRLGLPRSTAYRLLAVLVEHGYVTYLAEQRRYGLGVAAYELGSAYQRQAPLQRIARPLLHSLVDHVHQNAHLAVLHGRDVLYLIEERAPRRPLLVTDVGVRLPSVRTASGLAMLAALSREQVRALFPDAAAFPDAGDEATGVPTSPTALRRLLVDVRTRGHATEEGSVTAGLSSVAQAVRDHNGYPAAAVAITYAAEDVDDDGVRDLVRAASSTAATLSRRLGFRG